MNITEKVAYLKGLIEGIGIDETKNEGKIIKAMADVLEDLALSVSDLEDDYAELYAQVDEIDEDLGALESDFYEFDDCDCDCDCDDDFDFDDSELYEVTCPNCGDTLCLDEDMLDEGSIDCPGCGETLEFDLDCCCDDDDCGCGCGHDHE